MRLSPSVGRSVRRGHRVGKDRKRAFPPLPARQQLVAVYPAFFKSNYLPFALFYGTFQFRIYPHENISATNVFPNFLVVTYKTAADDWAGALNPLSPHHTLTQMRVSNLSVTVWQTDQWTNEPMHIGADLLTASGLTIFFSLKMGIKL